MSLPDRKIPIIQIDESTGIITVQWFDGLTALDTRIAALEAAPGAAGSDLFTYQQVGAL